MSNETKVRGPVDVRGILERAGADADAPDGSQAWALAQVDAAVAELIEADREYDEARKAHGETYHSGGMTERSATHRALEDAKKRRAVALANVGGAK